MTEVTAEAAVEMEDQARLSVWQRIRVNSIEIMALGGGILIWEAVGWLLGLPWLPPFSRVIGALAELVSRGSILGNLVISLQALGIGFGLALVVGLVLGVLMGRYDLVNRTLDVYVYGLFVSPSLIFAPIFFAIFGLSDGTRVAVIFTYSVFIIIINTRAGIRTVDPRLIEMARSFGASERHLIFRVLVPGALPLVFAGIRLGAGRAVKGMINGEMLIALVGLGGLARKYGGQFDTASILAIALVVALVALVVNLGVQAADNRMTRWAD